MEVHPTSILYVRLLQARHRPQSRQVADRRVYHLATVGKPKNTPSPARPIHNFTARRVTLFVVMT
jgi:hypothetical protein